jgi:hypothetical protein
MMKRAQVLSQGRRFLLVRCLVSLDGPIMFPWSYYLDGANRYHGICFSTMVGNNARVVGGPLEKDSDSIHTGSTVDESRLSKKPMEEAELRGPRTTEGYNWSNQSI